MPCFKGGTWWLVLALLAPGCGRVFYDPLLQSDAGVADGAADGAPDTDGATDSAVLDAAADASTADAAADAATDAGLGPPVAFVTSTTIVPINTDRADADATCATAASNAGLSGTFVAWYARGGSAAAPLAGSGGWVRTDGRPIVPDLTALTDFELIYPIALDEFGVDQRQSGAEVATASDSEGDPLQDCAGFANPNGTITVGVQASTTRDAITHTQNGSCDEAYHLYCFEIGRAANVSIQPETGRIAFVSQEGFSPSDGLAAADALCAMEASTGGLTGSFAALLATPGVPAIDRFSPAPARWVRPDGVFLATGSDFAADRLLTTISIRANGSRSGVFDIAFSGARSVSDGSDVRTCVSWTSGSAMDIGYFGRVGDSIQFFGRQGSAIGCDTRRNVYCLERATL